jgi:hypothetical protein
LHFAVQGEVHGVQERGFAESVVSQDQGDILLRGGGEVEGMFTAKLSEVLNDQLLQDH